MSSFSRLAVRGAALVAFGAGAALAPVEALALDAATQVVDNPYGLDALWAQGDFVARGVLVGLVLMSITTWYVFVTKLVEQHRLLRLARRANTEPGPHKTPHDRLAALDENSPFRAIAQNGIEALERHNDGLADRIDLHTWVTLAVQRAQEPLVVRLQSGLSVLATVGATAPFIGLFGTVWGIYHALTAIGIAGQASIDKVAGPVGESLIMTAVGLGVAVPAVLGYNWLVRRNKAVVDSLRHFTASLHSALIAAPVSRAASVQPASRAA